MTAAMTASNRDIEPGDTTIGAVLDVADGHVRDVDTKIGGDGSLDGELRMVGEGGLREAAGRHRGLDAVSVGVEM